MNIFNKNIETFLGNSSWIAPGDSFHWLFFWASNNTNEFASASELSCCTSNHFTHVCADGRQVLSAECEHAGKGQRGMAKGTHEGMRGMTLQGSQNLHQACIVQWSWVCLWCLPPQMFEIQAKERINFLRNTVWTHLNQLSQQCVTSDEVRHRRILLFIFTLTTN